MSSAVILGRNWKSKQVRPGHSLGGSVACVQPPGERQRAGLARAAPEGKKGLLEVDQALGFGGRVLAAAACEDCF